MSQVEVDKIIPQSGTTLTVGESGDTITVPSGATFDASNATTTLPATVVTTDGSQTLTNKTIDASQLTGTITPSDNTVTNAKIVDSTIQLAKLSATGTKDATTFLRGDNTFATVSSDYVRLSTTTISADTSSVSFDGHFTSDYDTYIVYGNVQLDANSQVRARVRKSNSDVTSSNYTQAAYGNNSAGSENSQNNAGDSFFILNRDATIGNYRFNFETVIFNPLATYNHMIKSFSSFYGSDGNVWWYLQSGLCDNNTNALSGISYFPSTGNFDAGTIVLYGVKK